jgi:hypothetical protein
MKVHSDDGLQNYDSWVGCQVSDNWQLTLDGDNEARKLFDRHYSRIRYADGRQPKLFCGPGSKMVLVRRSYDKTDALFVWRSFIDQSGQDGLNCSVFRNESDVRSSDLILEAEEVAINAATHFWFVDTSRFYTYVNAKQITSSNPGYCFKKAGWRDCGTTKGGLHILSKSQ